MTTVDAVVVGGGPNGLVAAAALADAGWDVCLVEASDRVGGAVRSEERFPGYTTDMYSAFYPLAAASSVIRSLELERHGLRWVNAPAVVAHPHSPEADDCAVLHHRPEDTAAALARFAPRDGDAWMRLWEQWTRIRGPLLNALFTPFPPVRPMMRLLARTGTGDALRLARFLALPAHRMGEELFDGEPARLLLAGNAMHADVPFDAAVSGAFGWLLAMLGQDVGFPSPEGGAGRLAEALGRRAEAAGAAIVLGDRVERIVVRGGRAAGVVTAGGRRIRVRRAVVADVGAPVLYRRLLPRESVPRRLLEDLDFFEYDTPTVKVNWALSGRIPWRARSARAAGTVHVGADERGLVQWSADLTTKVVPRHPFLLFGQMTTTDPTRSPEGTESAWAYTHLPRDVYDDESGTELANRVDEVVERYAPGFTDLVVGREVQLPGHLTGGNANLVNGAVNGGTAQLHQMLVFRPVPGLGRPETPVPGVFLGSASAHPGGGVHGAPGWLAARAALGQHGPLGAARRQVTSRLLETIYRDRPSAR
ncbi:MAG: NAD(P)/FAD-dependent oxidoreductase [Actinomycetota bacterium]|nr:NAD(P)/FAD-dependent oxidoreductase [Actinomycetota bacterium]